MNKINLLMLATFILVYLLGVLAYTCSRKDGHYRVWNDKYLDSEHQITFKRAYVLNVICFITYA